MFKQKTTKEESISSFNTGIGSRASIPDHTQGIEKGKTKISNHKSYSKENYKRQKRLKRNLQYTSDEARDDFIRYIQTKNENKGERIPPFNTGIGSRASIPEYSMCWARLGRSVSYSHRKRIMR